MARLALVEQVVAAVELDLDLGQPFRGFGREAGAIARLGEQSFLLGRQGIDVVEHRNIVHNDRLHSVPSDGGLLINQR